MASARQMALLMPAIVIVVTSLVLAGYCHTLMADAAAADRPALDDMPLLFVVGGFVLASAALVVVQASRVAHRVEGPERRLVEALRRMRQGDLSFRVHLRRGDPLGGVARECNELLDWLNANPPAGVQTGGDIVEVGPAPAGEDAP